MIVIPRSPDEFIAQITRQAMTETASVQDALQGYLVESAERSDACVDAWLAAQRASMSATFAIQNAVLQLSQTILGTDLLSGPPAIDRPARNVPPPSPRLVKLRVITLPPNEGPVRPDLVPREERTQAYDWASSALRFQPPVGIICADYGAFLDREP